MRAATRFRHAIIDAAALHTLIFTLRFRAACRAMLTLATRCRLLALLSYHMRVIRFTLMLDYDDAAAAIASPLMLRFFAIISLRHDATRCTSSRLLLPMP